MKLFSAIYFLFAVQNAVAQSPVVKHVFTLNELPATVEGMTYDPVDSNFYFSESVNLKILRYTKNGKPSDYIDAKANNIHSLLGMTTSPYSHELWVCGSIMLNEKNTMCLFQFDLKSGLLIQKYPDASGIARLFNDVAITTDGEIFITDSDAKAIYRVNKKNKLAELYLQSDSLKDANGITAFSNTLFVSTSGGLIKINTTDKKLVAVKLENYRIAGIDGLYFYNNSLIGIQNVFFPVTIGRYYMNSNQSAVIKASVISANHPAFDAPTTGVIVGDDFYFMSNTNLLYYDFEKNKVANEKLMKKIKVMKVKLSK